MIISGNRPNVDFPNHHCDDILDTIGVVLECCVVLEFSQNDNSSRFFVVVAVNEEKLPAMGLEY